MKRKNTKLQSELIVETADSNDHKVIEQLLADNELPVPSCDGKLVRFFTVRQNEKVIACLGWESYGFMVLLRSLAVQHMEQRKGIGSILVQNALARLSAEGVREFYLLTSTASAFAERLGFKTIDRCALPDELKVSEQMVSDCCMTAQCMQLRVEC